MSDDNEIYLGLPLKCTRSLSSSLASPSLSEQSEKNTHKIFGVAFDQMCVDDRFGTLKTIDSHDRQLPTGGCA